jgi:hypothetical protein
MTPLGTALKLFLILFSFFSKKVPPNRVESNPVFLTKIGTVAVLLCPLSGVKRTCRLHRKMSAYDPKRTSVNSQLQNLSERVGGAETRSAIHAGKYGGSGWSALLISNIEWNPNLLAIAPHTHARSADKRAAGTPARIYQRGAYA